MASARPCSRARRSSILRHFFSMPPKQATEPPHIIAADKRICHVQSQCWTVLRGYPHQEPTKTMRNLALLCHSPDQHQAGDSLPTEILLFFVESKKAAQRFKSFPLYHHDACFHSFAWIKGYISAMALMNTIRRCKHCICDGRQLKLYEIFHVLCCATCAWTFTSVQAAQADCV
jgi:hypothetical protein